VPLLVLPWAGFLCDTWLGAVIGADWDRYRAAVRVAWL
jgi:hypothetical protein